MAKNNVGGDEARSIDTDDAGDDDEAIQMKEIQDKLAQVVQAKVAEELSSHITRLEVEMKDAFNQRMMAMADQCTNQVATVTSTRKIDILRTNKVFRDISRPLGANWRPVFDKLMSRFPSDVVIAERTAIEQDRPVLQPYKALMTWKEACGSEFDVRNLVDVLRQFGLDDLAQTTLQILDNNETDSLIELSGIGKTSSVGTSKSGNVACVTASFHSHPAGASASTLPKSSIESAPSRKVDAEEVLDDRHLLQLAKRLGAEWESLGKALNVPDDELAETLVAEGKTYQGAFKMLWNWRESSTVLTLALESLMAALGQLGHQDLIDQVLH